VYGAIVAGYVVLIALSAVDPDALVARVNLQRAAEGREIDTHHVLTLSADAVPVVLAQFETLSPADRDRIAKTYLARYGAPANDWRTWNVARAEAERQVREHHAILQSALLPVATPP
jgi:hypothetical protein